MSEHEASDAAVETGSGIYRKLSPHLLRMALFVLWAVMSALIGMGYIDVKNLREQMAVMQSFRDDVKDSIREMKSDIKELLREVRK